MIRQNTDTRVEVQGSRDEVQGVNLAPFPLHLVPESSGRSFSYGNRTAYPLRVHSSKGFTLIELVIVICIVAFLAGKLLTSVWFYQEMAEKAAMQQVQGALQSALVLQYSRLLTRGREAEIKNLLAENPMNWLMQLPSNYSGELYDIKPAAIVPGNWAFDLKTHELIYVPDHSDYFDPGKDGLKWVRYRARLLYDPVRGGANKGAEELTGLLFAPVERYQWIVRGEK